MDPRFAANNTHLEDPAHFAENDPQLRRLLKQHYIHHPALLNELPVHIPGIYTLGGGRQIGKTTLLKQWMEKLLTENISPAAIAFFSGELIDDHHSLLHFTRTMTGHRKLTPAKKWILLHNKSTVISHYFKSAWI